MEKLAKEAGLIGYPSIYNLMTMGGTKQAWGTMAYYIPLKTLEGEGDLYPSLSDRNNNDGDGLHALCS